MAFTVKLEPLGLRCLLYLFVVAVLVACGQSSPDSGAEPASSIEPGLPLEAVDRYQPGDGFVGSAACAGCHQQVSGDWQKSHHDLAMQEANADTIVGDFNQATFDYFGSQTRFYHKDDKYFVFTEGTDGKPREFPIAYTFGVYPLQQYLIEFPGGRLQALNIVWDARSVEEGGQRWYHLYPDEPIRFDDELHWTGINHNWNFMCADCHSTNLKKNYALETQIYSTTWSEIDVGCEACHGPGAEHLRWASNQDGEAAVDAQDYASGSMGLDIHYQERAGVAWHIDPETGNAKRQPQKNTHIEIDSCARCHSRRATMFPGATPQDDFLDHFRLSLLEPGLYHADGQIDGEVYVYGSFLQSKMYHAGVSCSDCHNPHSLELRITGNDLCGQCHLATKYDTDKHHFHMAGTAGAQCVNCHMPAKNFMQVDTRRDHSFRIPRPDLSQHLDTPNACNQCHSDKSAAWAAAELSARGKIPGGSEWADTVYMARRGDAGADAGLVNLVLDTSRPALVRATAVGLLPRYFSSTTAPVLQSIAQGDDALLSFALASQLSSIPERYRAVFAVPLLYEKQATTRALAASNLPPQALAQLPKDVLKHYEGAVEEYERSELFNADRPESLVNLARLYSQRGESAKAADFFQKAIHLAPYFVPAYVNFADFYQQQGDERSGQAVLRKALDQVRDARPIHHALGLSLVRSGDKVSALDHLKASAEGEDGNDYFRYVYGVALNSLGKPAQALEVLERAHRDAPANRDIIVALASIYRDQGNEERSKYFQSLL